MSFLAKCLILRSHLLQYFTYKVGANNTDIDSMGSALPTSAYGSQQWTLDPSDTIMQTSEYTLQPGLDSLSTPSEPLEAMLASPGNFDWVSPPFVILKLLNELLSAAYSSNVHLLMTYV